MPKSYLPEGYGNQPVYTMANSLTPEELEEVKKYVTSDAVWAGSQGVVMERLKSPLELLLEQYGPDATLGSIQEAQAFQRAIQDEPPPLVKRDPLDFDILGWLPSDVQEKLTRRNGV